ncbi:unnamed protein product [Malus baccata var. baccata]
MADNRTLKELATLNTDQQPLCITYPNAEGGFELKSGMIHYLPKFYGFSTKDANKHLKEFHVVCSRMRPSNVDEEQVKLSVFSFTLEAKAKEWLYNLPPGSMNTWNQVKQAFLEQYFPATKAASIRKDICAIRQQHGEPFGDYYEWFTHSVASCPNHQISKHLLLQYFYEGLCGTDRVMLDAASGGAFMDKTPTNVKALLKNIAGNTRQFGVRDELPLKKVNEVSANSSIELQLANLTNLVQQVMVTPKQVMKFKKEQTNKEILDNFRKVQVPKYAMFLKELRTNKRKFNDPEIMALSEEVSTVLQRKLPPKLKDASSFTIICVIGGKKFGRTLCNLGASINLMPYSVYKSLNFGELKETKVMEHDPMPTALPLILGRQLLRTARTKIDVYNGTLTMEIDGENVKFRIFNAMRYPSDFESCLSIDAFDYFVQDCFNEGVEQDNLEKVLVHSITHGKLNYSEHIEEELIQTVAALKSLTPIRGFWWRSAKPTREAQCRLNPLMMEVVKKKVIKLLDVGIIYPILDSKYSGYNQIAVALEDQEKTTFTCPFGTNLDIPSLIIDGPSFYVSAPLPSSTSPPFAPDFSPFQLDILADQDLGCSRFYGLH